MNENNNKKMLMEENTKKMLMVENTKKLSNFLKEDKLESFKEIEKIVNTFQIPIKLENEIKIDFKDLPLAQARTRKLNKFVYIKPEVVIKGPYKSNEYTLHNELIFSSCIEEALPIMYVLIMNNGLVYFARKNIGDPKIVQDNTSIIYRDTKIDTNFKVFKKDKNFVKYFKQVDDKTKEKFMPRIVDYFCKSAGYNLADTQFNRNVILHFVDNMPYGIDFENFRGKNMEKVNFKNLHGQDMYEKDKKIFDKYLKQITENYKPDQRLKDFKYINFENIKTRFEKINKIIADYKNGIIEEDKDINNIKNMRKKRISNKQKDKHDKIKGTKKIIDGKKKICKKSKK